MERVAQSAGQRGAFDLTTGPHVAANKANQASIANVDRGADPKLSEGPNLSLSDWNDRARNIVHELRGRIPFKLI